MAQMDRRTIYQQDCESFRYQDKLFWSRLQTLSVLEGAAIWAVFFSNLAGCPIRILAIAAILVVSLICMIALKDYDVALNFLIRMGKYEKEMKVDQITPRKLFGIFRGIDIARIIFSTLLLFNIYLVWFAFQKIQKRIYYKLDSKKSIERLQELWETSRQR